MEHGIPSCSGCKSYIAQKSGILLYFLLHKGPYIVNESKIYSACRAVKYLHSVSAKQFLHHLAEIIREVLENLHMHVPLSINGTFTYT